MSELDAIGFGALNVDKLFRVNRIAAAEEESFVVDHQRLAAAQRQTPWWPWQDLAAR